MSDVIANRDTPREGGGLPKLDDARAIQCARALANYRYDLWNWGESIGLEGLFAASLLSGDRWYAGLAHGVIKAWCQNPRPLQETDNTAAGKAMCLAYRASNDSAILAKLRDLAEFLTRRRRGPGGAFISGERALLRQPYGPSTLEPAEVALLRDPGAAIYVDEMHMTPPLHANLGSLLDEEAWIDVAASQCLAYARLLQDDGGLFWHFWLEKTEQRYCLGWGRGQGWALLGMLDVLAELPGEHPARSEISERIAGLIEAVSAHQLEDGGWHALLGIPRSGRETSTAAFMVAGVLEAISRGVGPAESAQVAARAWDYMLGQVDSDGIVRGVSAAVYASTQQSHYCYVPTGFVVPWGQGPVLVAALRVDEHLHKADVDPAETQRSS